VTASVNSALYNSVFEYDGPFEEGLKLLIMTGVNWNGENPKFLNQNEYKYYGNLIDYNNGNDLYQLKKKLKKEIKF
jgi:hypothetical protein